MLSAAIATVVLCICLTGLAGAAQAEQVPSIAPSPRVISIGDLHGDFESAQLILRDVGVMDDAGHWSGGGTTLIQTGDITDRGDASGPIFETFFRLQDEAPKSGGSVIMLLGNHEMLNLEGNYAYVTGSDTTSLGGDRKAAFAPSGWVGQRLRATAQTVALAGPPGRQALYVHAGLLPEFAEWISARTIARLSPAQASPRAMAEELNEVVREMLAGPQEEIREQQSAPLMGWAGPFWTRRLAEGKKPCEDVDRCLRLFEASRMIVGHTPQEDGRVRTRCGGRLVLADTLISRAYTGKAHPSAVELTSDGQAFALYPGGGDPVRLPDPEP